MDILAALEGTGSRDLYIGIFGQVRESAAPLFSN